MKVDKEQKRLKAIKLRYILFPKECNCCRKKYKNEKMWRVKRYGIDEPIINYYYCQSCMHSPQDVLNEIYTDSSVFGIVGVDDFFIEKKDSSKFNKTYIRDRTH